MYRPHDGPCSSSSPRRRFALLLLLSTALASSVAQAQPVDSLLLHLEFEDDLLDSSGNLHDGTGVGTLDYAAGVLGMAASFSGDDSVHFSSIPDAAFSTTDFSITFWFDTPLDRQASFVGKRGTCDISPFLDIRSHPGTINFAISNSSNNHVVNATRTSGWRFYAAVREAGFLRLYIDGALWGATSVPSIDIENSAPFGIGISPCIGIDGTETLLGLIDDLRVYERALTPVEVASFTGLVLADGFESGDTSGWSSTTP